MEVEPNELTCAELVELLTDYLDGSLSERDRSRFEFHLAQCHDCESHLAEFRETIETLGVLAQESLDPGVRERLLEAFRDWNWRTKPAKE